MKISSDGRFGDLIDLRLMIPNAVHEFIDQSDSFSKRNVLDGMTVVRQDETEIVQLKYSTGQYGIDRRKR